VKFVVEWVDKYISNNTFVMLLQISRADDSGDEIESVALSEKSRHQHQPVLPPYRASVYGSKRALYTNSTTKLPQTYSIQNLQSTTLGVGAGTTEGPDTASKLGGGLPPPELMAFIERQEDYIEQLEKESQYCRVCILKINMHERIILPLVLYVV
jgi:serologically defined colon cancer antigen 8